MAKLAMESKKQAASLPRPPLPKPASSSMSSNSSMSSPTLSSSSLSAATFNQVLCGGVRVQLRVEVGMSQQVRSNEAGRIRQMKMKKKKKKGMR